MFVEDVMDVVSCKGGKIKIVVLCLNWIVNFDDLDLLVVEFDVIVDIIEVGCFLFGDVDLILIFGSKSIIVDLVYFCV